MNTYVLGIRDVDKTMIAVVGGKGANLGELSRVDGVRVPEGFCVCAAAYERVVRETGSLHRLLEELSALKTDGCDGVSQLSAAIRRAIIETAIPDDIQREITQALAALWAEGAGGACAVRSSATAEDLPAASFAGLHDTYLSIIGRKSILEHISRCWALLFSERAVSYRLRNGIGHQSVSMAVVVQKMVFPQAAGVMFTADPVTGNRKALVIEAVPGSAEGLVSGQVNAEVYMVRAGEIIAAPEPEAGSARRGAPALTRGQVLRLQPLGRRIEAHFGCPQDIEWCLAGDEFYIVQARPITTLYPVPDAGDGERHVYVSVGHQQMMTDAMKPLGLSLFQATAMRPMYAAGGRLFVDITRELASPAGREALLNTLGRSDPLIRDALTAIMERGDFGGPPPGPGVAKGSGIAPAAAAAAPPDIDPATVSQLIEESQAAIQELSQAIQGTAGPDLLNFLFDDIQRLKKSMSHPQSVGVIMAAVNSSAWLNEKMREWLGELNAADALSQSAPNNVTSEMGLALLDVADALRPYPAVIEYLQRAAGDDFLEGLATVDGGLQAREAIGAYLDRYGMRCAGEIDITRPRWSEQPSAILPTLLANVRNFGPHAGRRMFEEGARRAAAKAREILSRLRQLPDGESKAEQAERMIQLMRSSIGYREYPKYAIVSRYLVYKQALLREARRLVQAGVLQQEEDVYYLTLEELREVVRTGRLDHGLIRAWRDEHKLHERLAPPRLITSDGEIIAGRYLRGGIPSGALPGMPVSAGVVEGRARVILHMERAGLEDGDILVTRYTDPGWTVLFVAARGLVTEMGGLMTHGAVIAREYGLPAVVGVERATELIKDGQLIRVHGTEGYVEIL